MSLDIRRMAYNECCSIRTASHHVLPNLYLSKFVDPYTRPCQLKHNCQYKTCTLDQAGEYQLPTDLIFNS